MILYSHLWQGLEIVRKDRIKDVCIWQGPDETIYTVDFGFLSGMPYIETFHFLVNLSKGTDLEGLYFLSNLRDFRWAVNNTIAIDFSKLITIEILNISYYDGIALDKLVNLRELYISSVKTNDLMFLPTFDRLEQLRITNGKFTSLVGLERCKNIKKLDLRGCFRLMNANSTLQKLHHLEFVALDKSEKYDIDFDELRARVPYVGIV